MKIGINGYFVTDTNRDRLLRWLRRVDDGPFATIATGERVLSGHLDQFAFLAAAAAVTERVTIMSNITIVPLHPAVLLAKRLATLDLLSGGRLAVGVGTGSREDDYLAAGASMERRWQRLDDSVETMRSIWNGDSPFRGASGSVGPRPVQAGGPPILTSASAPKALARAARWANGWQGSILDADPQRLRSEAESHRAAWEAAGRDAAPYLMNAVCIGSRNTESAGARNSLRSDLPLHPVKNVPVLVERCREAGYDELLFAPITDDIGVLDQLEQTLMSVK